MNQGDVDLPSILIAAYFEIVRSSEVISSLAHASFNGIKSEEICALKVIWKYTFDFDRIFYIQRL